VGSPAQRREHRRRPRDRHDRSTGGDRGRHDAEAGVGEQRRPRLRDQRHVLAGGEQPRDLAGARRFVGVVARNDRAIVARGAVLRQKSPCGARVLGDNHVGVAQRGSGARREIAGVAERRGDDEEGAGTDIQRRGLVSK